MIVKYLSLSRIVKDGGDVEPAALDEALGHVREVAEAARGGAARAREVAQWRAGRNVQTARRRLTADRRLRGIILRRPTNHQRGGGVRFDHTGYSCFISLVYGEIYREIYRYTNNSPTRVGDRIRMIRSRPGCPPASRRARSWGTCAGAADRAPAAGTRSRRSAHAPGR